MSEGEPKHLQQARRVFSIPDDVEVATDSTGYYTHWPARNLVVKSWWLLRTEYDQWRLDYGRETIAISEDMEKLRLPYVIAKLERGL